MAQDTALLRYLLKGARRAPGSGSQRDLAFAFDGTNDYISSPTIGRTGYDMNVSGNVTTGSDGDGDYFWINGNRDKTAGTGTRAQFGTSTTPVFNQGNSLTIKAKVKFNSFVANNVGGIFGSDADFAMHVESGTNKARYTVRGSTNVNIDTASALSLNTLYDLYLAYDSSNSKFYGYISTAGGASTLINAGGTTGPATFSTDARQLGDGAIGAGNASSQSMYIYHACIRNKALTQAEIDADIALGNTTKQDPSIVAYYIPENLTYNTQYTGSPKNLSIAPRSLSGTSSVTADTTVAPDGTTTADTLQITGTATQGIDNPNLTITGATIASKTFIVKAFVKVATGTALFRLKMSHRGVADYFSADLTATTTRQEFTFAQTFTSSTSGTGIVSGIVNSTGVTNPLLQVRNVRCYLANETLRDESPNIGGYIGRKTPVVMSAWVKLGIDSVSSATKQVAFQVPRRYLQLRDTINILHFRSETTLAARTAAVFGSAILGNGNRDKVHVLGVSYRDGTGWLHKAYVNGVQTSGAPVAYTSTVRPASTIYRTNASVGFYVTDYFSGNIRDARVYTFTGSFTNADALAIYNGGEPTSAGVTKYLHYRPPVGEVGTTTQDQSPNDRDGTLNGGVTRDYI